MTEVAIERRRLRKSGIDVTTVGLGTWRILDVTEPGDVRLCSDASMCSTVWPRALRTPTG